MSTKSITAAKTTGTLFGGYQGNGVVEDGRIRMECIEDEHSLNKLSEQWEKLAVVADAPVYMTYEWLSRWWKHFGRHPKRKLYVMAIFDTTDLVGLAPFFLGKSSIGPIVFQKRLHLMGSGVEHNELLGFKDDYGYSDFLDLLSHPDYKTEVADCITSLLLANPMDVDVICMQHVSDDSFVMNCIYPRLEERVSDLRLQKTDECPYIDLPDTMKEYKQEKQYLGSSSRRRRFRKNLNPVNKKYPVEKVTSWPEVKKQLEILITLHQERWNSRGYPGAFFDERHRRFLMDMSREACNKGWLWFAQAHEDNEFGAVRMSIKYNRVYYDWLSGFDETSSISNYRPGLGLLSLMIKEGIDEGASRIEMLRGDERYKFDFTRESKYNWRLTVPLYTRKGRFRSLVNRFLNSTAELFTQLLREWTLLKVQYRENGLFKMFYGYGCFRAETISQKIQEMNLFSEKN